MVHYTILFLVIAIVAGLFGFGGVVSTATGIAKILFFLFLVLTLISFIKSK